MTETIVTGPYETKAKADHPRFGVTVKDGDFVSHRYFEGRDQSTSGRADAMAEAEEYAARVRREGGR